MSGSDGEARGLTMHERGEVAEIIIKWRDATDGYYDVHFLNALMGFVRATVEILDLAAHENQSKKPAEDA